MSFSGQAILALHVAAAIFALGPGTAAIMSTPRYIRKGNAAVVRYLYRTTRIYAVASVLVLVFGLILAQIQHDFSKWWISVSITLYVVAAVLLVMILGDQRRAVTALESASAPGTAIVPAGPARLEGDGTGEPAHRSGEDEEAAGDGGQADGEQPAATPAPSPAVPAPAEAASVAASAESIRVAAVARARISSLSGVVALIWLVSLVLMVWK
jgi:hypothetical protein